MFTVLQLHRKGFGSGCMQVSAYADYDWSVACTSWLGKLTAAGLIG